MPADLDDLRALLMANDELLSLCSEVLTVLEHGEPLVETLNFNVVDVTVDRPRHQVTVQGVLSVNDETLTFPEEQFRDMALTVAQPLTGEPLADWHQHRKRRVWPMPPPAN